MLVFQRGHDANRAAGPEVADEESVAPGEKLNHSDRTTVVKDERKEASGPKGGVFHWRNLCYDITIKGQPRRILDGVSGWVQPGTLTALMVCCDPPNHLTLSPMADTHILLGSHRCWENHSS